MHSSTREFAHRERLGGLTSWPWLCWGFQPLEVIVRVPESVIMNERYCDSIAALAPLWQHAAFQRADTYNVRHPRHGPPSLLSVPKQCCYSSLPLCVTGQKMTVCLLWEKAKGSEGFWAPYLDILPRHHDIVLGWSDDELDELQDPYGATH